MVIPVKVVSVFFIVINSFVVVLVVPIRIAPEIVLLRSLVSVIPVPTTSIEFILDPVILVTLSVVWALLISVWSFVVRISLHHFVRLVLIIIIRVRIVVWVVLVAMVLALVLIWLLVMPLRRRHLILGRCFLRTDTLLIIDPRVFFFLRPDTFFFLRPYTFFFLRSDTLLFILLLRVQPSLSGGLFLVNVIGLMILFYDLIWLDLVIFEDGNVKCIPAVLDVIKILGLCPQQSRRFIELLPFVILNLLRLLLLIKVGVLVAILSNQAEVLLKVGILGVDLELFFLVEVVKAGISLRVGIIRVPVAPHLHDGAN